MTELCSDPAVLVKELRAKAWQSTRSRKNHDDHVCWRAADKLEELCRSKDGSVPIRAVREIFTRLLRLSYDQRAYSWHEIQHCLGEVEKSALDTPPNRGTSHQIETYKKLCSAAYQLAGVVGAPLRFLDALGDGANGELGKRVSIDTLLPVHLDECKPA